jgi:hypothetical protein
VIIIEEEEDPMEMVPK